MSCSYKTLLICINLLSALLADSPKLQENKWTFVGFKLY